MIICIKQWDKLITFGKYARTVAREKGLFGGSAGKYHETGWQESVLFIAGGRLMIKKGNKS